jgi:hypothetical protein
MTCPDLDPQTAAPADLAAALRLYGDVASMHSHRRGALHIVLEGSRGDLVDLGGVRDAVVLTNGVPRINWTLLAATIDEMPVSAGGEAMLRMACLLAGVESTGRAGLVDLWALDAINKGILAEGFAIAAGLDPGPLNVPRG